MQKILLSKDFYKSVDRLDPVIKAKVLKTMMQFQSDPNGSGLNLERLEDCADPRMCSIRVDLPNRIILCWLEAEQAYIFLYAARHDDAYAWARKKRVSVNDAVKTIQLYDIPDKDAAPEENGLFPPVKYSDRTLACLGVPEEQLPLVRAIRDVDHLLEDIERFPADVQERLLDLSTGTPLSEVLRGVEEASAGPDPFESPETLRAFTVGPVPPELAQALTEGSLEQWRVFLHPAQRRLTREHFSGSALVEGGAGTGKTITALHRAKALAARMIAEKQEGLILFTFFTANLIDDNRSKLRSICTPEEFKRIVVQNIDKVYAQPPDLPSGAPEIYFLGSEELKPVWKEAAAQGDPEGLRPVSFYQREWDSIVAEQEAFTLQEYQKLRRDGGGKPLKQEQREQVWKVFMAYRRIMDQQRMVDNKMAMYRFRKELEENEAGAGRYRHVIVDEVQDFGTGALRLVRALAGEPHPDDIFLVGDSRQRIYDRRTSLAAAGINVNGRRHKLYLNYRTTYQLQRAAIALLEGERFQDLNGEPDESFRYFSCTSGAEPQVRFFATEEEERQWVLSELRALISQGVSPRDICLTAFKRQAVKDCLKWLGDNDLQPYELKRTDDRALGGVRVGTMHRVKGMEFQYMFIVGVNKDVFPPKDARGAFLKQAKCLLYVALTRAQKGAYVSGFGREQSKFLTALMEDG